MLDTAGIHHVNVAGADQVLEACRQCPSVRLLVYTSTYNVVFAGQGPIFIPLLFQLNFLSHFRCVYQ